MTMRLVADGFRAGKAGWTKTVMACAGARALHHLPRRTAQAITSRVDRAAAQPELDMVDDEHDKCAARNLSQPSPNASTTLESTAGTAERQQATAASARARTEFNKVCSVLEDSFHSLRNTTEGEVATQIPQLGAVNPSLFSVAACSSEGQLFSLGDESIPFTLQSAIFPIVYAHAVQLHGWDEVCVIINKHTPWSCSCFPFSY